MARIWANVSLYVRKFVQANNALAHTDPVFRTRAGKYG
jgi:hypothetical protein